MTLVEAPVGWIAVSHHMEKMHGLDGDTLAMFDSDDLRRLHYELHHGGQADVSVHDERKNIVHRHS